MEDKQLTIGDIIQEVNRWLAFKKKTADNAKELPSTYGATEYLKKQLTSEISNLGNQVITAYRKDSHAKKNDLKDADIWGLTLLDFSVPSNGGLEFKVLTYLLSGEETLLTFKFVVYTIDGCTAVEEVITDIDQKTTLLSVIEQAVKMQVAQHADLNSRWLGTPCWYRKGHPICAVCGAPVEVVQYNEDKGRSRMYCDRCSWTSMKKVNDASDYVDKKTFQAEVENAQKIQNAKRTLVAGLAAVADALQSLEEVSTEVNQYIIDALSGIDFHKELTKFAERVEALKTQRPKT